MYLWVFKFLNKIILMIIFDQGDTITWILIFLCWIKEKKVKFYEDLTCIDFLIKYLHKMLTEKFEKNKKKEEKKSTSFFFRLALWMNKYVFFIFYRLICKRKRENTHLLSRWLQSQFYSSNKWSVCLEFWCIFIYEEIEGKKRERERRNNDVKWQEIDTSGI